MKRREALELFAQVRQSSPAVTGPSFGGRVLHEVAHEPATLYNMELGYAVAVCMGLAMTLPSERIYAVEGDGSLIAGLASLTTVARYAPPNLVILVFNNRSWATTGGQPTAARTGTDIQAVAQAAGLTKACHVADTDALIRALADAAGTHGPHLIVIDIEDEDVRNAGQSPAYPFDIVESAIRFRRNLEDRGLVPTIWAV